MKSEVINKQPLQKQILNKVTILDVLDWNTQIEPYPITLLIGGCGSLKSTLIDKIVCHELENVPHYRTAIILSRASKRKEILSNNAKYSGKIGFDGNVFIDDKTDYFMFEKFNIVPERYEEYYNKDGLLVQDACVIPIQADNFMLDAAFTDQEDLFGLLDILWNQFDLIVIDEIHSLLLDSGFMISQARIGEMIKRFAKKCKEHNKHMILMTATADCIKPLLKQWIPKIHILDFTKSTFCVMPKMIRITPKEQVKRELELLYCNNIKFIYFYNGKAQFLSEICDEGSALKEEDGVSLFSDLEMRDFLRNTNKKEYEKMLEVEKYLAKNKRFPDWVKYVFSTSKNREGISIENTDFVQMYVDSHIPSEVIQYSGRLRFAEYTLTIVDGSYQYYPETEYTGYDKDYLDKLNETFASSKDEKYRRYLIEKVESKKWMQDGFVVENPDYQPYIFFNPFSFRFEVNELKIQNEKYIIQCIRKWNSINRKYKTSFSSYIRSWFPKPVEVQPYETKEWQSFEILRKNKILINPNKNGSNSYYTDKKIQSLINELTPLWGKFARINTYLSRFDDKLHFEKIKYGTHKGMWELLRSK